MRGFGATLTLLLAATVLISGVALFQGWTTWPEAFGFVSGAVCVWLTAKENIWNWPIGLINVAFYAYVFFRDRLFADAGLQVVYFMLGVLGWYWWLHGGESKKQLHIDRTPSVQWLPLGVISLIGTVGMTAYLFKVLDAAPYLDASTTVLSLAAQYLLTRKYIENWLVWILVDIVYVPLYAWKGLYLTAILYAIFTVMAVGGLREWARLRAEQTGVSPFVPLWRPVQVGLALGVVAAAWIGYRCWSFEAFFSRDLPTIRLSDRVELIRMGRGGSLQPFALTAHQASVIRAEVLDPLSSDPGGTWPGDPRVDRNIPLPIAKIRFLAGDKQAATFVIDDSWQVSLGMGRSAAVSWPLKFPYQVDRF